MSDFRRKLYQIYHKTQKPLILPLNLLNTPKLSILLNHDINKLINKTSIQSNQNPLTPHAVDTIRPLLLYLLIELNWIFNYGGLHNVN